MPLASLLAPPTPEPLHVPKAAPVDDPEAVRTLHTRAETEMATWGGKSVQEEAAALLDDFTLQRFLQARPDGVDAALTMLRESSRWRAAHGVARSFAALHPAATDELRHPHHSSARAYFYGGAGGRARAAAPIPEAAQR